MADYAGLFAILLVGTVAALVLGGLHRKLARQPAPPPAEAASAPAEGSETLTVSPPADPRGGPESRTPVPFLVGALVVLVVEAGLVVLVPWALAVRSLGLAGLVGFGALVLPPALGLLHAASRSGDEW